MEQCQTRRPLVAVPFIQQPSDLTDAGMPPARLKRRKYMSTALLLVDELGFEPMTRQEASLFFRLVSYRYGGGAMLITTNKSIRAGPSCSPPTRFWPPPSSTACSTAPTSSTSRARSYRLRALEDALKLAHA